MANIQIHTGCNETSGLVKLIWELFTYRDNSPRNVLVWMKSPKEKVKEKNKGLKTNAENPHFWEAKKQTKKRKRKK